MTHFTRHDVVIDGRRLHVRRHGSAGPHVIFVSANAWGAQEWKSVQRRLPHLTTWSYDQAGWRYHRHRQRNPCQAKRGWSLQRAVQHLEAWLEAAGVGLPVTVVAHSLGGHVARAFIHRNPSSAAALLLIDARPAHWEQTLARKIATAVPQTGSVADEIAAADAHIDAIGPLAIPLTVVASFERFDAGYRGLSEEEKRIAAGIWREAQTDIACSVGQAVPLLIPGTGRMASLQAGWIAAMIDAAASTVGQPARASHTEHQG